METWRIIFDHESKQIITQSQWGGYASSFNLPLILGTKYQSIYVIQTKYIIMTT